MNASTYQSEFMSKTPNESALMSKTTSYQSELMGKTFNESAFMNKTSDNVIVKLTSNQNNTHRPVAEELLETDSIEIRIQDWKEYFDTVSGSQLDPTAVQAAMKEELIYMNSLPVWKKIRDSDVRPTDK